MEKDIKKDNKAVAEKSGKTAKPRQKSAKSEKGIGMIAGWITFLRETQVEMKKVTWPPRREILGSTTALLVATILIGIFLGVVDLVLAEGIQPALSGQPNIMSFVTLALFIGILLWVYKSN